MERRVAATEARVRFGEVIRRVAERNEAVVVEKGGKPLVVILSVEEYSRLKAGREGRLDWKRGVEHVRRLIAAELCGRRLPDAAETIREIRKERDAQLDRLLGR